MASSPQTSQTVNFFTSMTLLFGGSFGGTHLTAMVAPYSQWHGLVGFFMFPVAFVVGMRLWPWVDDLMERTRTLLTQTKLITNLIPSYSSRIIGSCSFVATSVITSCFAGLILTPPAMQIVIDPSYKTFIAAGAAYGAICWLLIQLGYLQQTRIYPKDS